MYRIIKTVSHPVIDFAAEELKKYLRMMMPRVGEIPIVCSATDADGFRLGTFDQFDLPTDGIDIPELDDAMLADCGTTRGILAGSNPRAVLLTVYEYLRANGCRWLFPGVDGELIPMQPVQPTSFRKVAAHRFRGQCNEGAEAQINMLETIDFTPKIGLNTYMLEFDIPSYYYDCWYSHKYNPYLPPEPLDNDTVLQWKRQCEVEIAKRGLLFHDMGHGWNAEPFGVDSSDAWAGVEKEEKPVPETAAPYLALMNGKRGFHDNIPLNTNVCLSDPYVRTTIANAVGDYAQTQNNVDFLHIWLADGSNNHCECEACRKMRPSDWYMLLLNEIDRVLTMRGLATRIVFIAYVDSYWPPETQRLEHPERFTLLFAPITRTYTTSYACEADPAAVTPYVRNKLVFPKDEKGNMAYFEKWREVFRGDVFCYEYHFYSKHYEDPGHLGIARLVYDDIRGIDQWGIRGIVEDQSQRSYFPTGFPMVLYGRALTDASLTFEDIRDDYFQSAFGEDWREALTYLDSVSDRFSFCYTAGSGRTPAEKAALLAEITALAQSFLPVIERNLRRKQRAQTVSWQLLLHHSELVPLLADAYRLRELDRYEEALAAFDAFLDRCAQKEPLLQRWLDVGLIGRTQRRAFLPPKA